MLKQSSKSHAPCAGKQVKLLIFSSDCDNTTCPYLENIVVGVLSDGKIRSSYNRSDSSLEIISNECISDKQYSEDSNSITSDLLSTSSVIDKTHDTYNIHLLEQIKSSVETVFQKIYREIEQYGPVIDESSEESLEDFSTDSEDWSVCGNTIKEDAPKSSSTFQVRKLGSVYDLSKFEMLSLVLKARPLALGELRDKILLLIKKIYRRQKNELCFGILDVKTSIEEMLADLIILAADAKNCMLPLDFFSCLTRMATNVNIPYVYVLTEKELIEACCDKPNVTVLSIKKGVVCFSAKVQEIKSAVESLANSYKM